MHMFCIVCNIIYMYVHTVSVYVYVMTRTHIHMYVCTYLLVTIPHKRTYVCMCSWIGFALGGIAL